MGRWRLGVSAVGSTAAAVSGCSSWCLAATAVENGLLGLWSVLQPSSEPNSASLFWLLHQEQKFSDPALLGWAEAGPSLAREPGRSCGLWSSSPRCSFSAIAFLLSLLVPACSGSPGGVRLCWL